MGGEAGAQEGGEGSSEKTEPHVHGAQPRGMFERNMPEAELLQVPQRTRVWSPEMSRRKRIEKLRSIR